MTLAYFDQLVPALLILMAVVAFLMVAAALAEYLKTGDTWAHRMTDRVIRWME